MVLAWGMCGRCGGTAISPEAGRPISTLSVSTIRGEVGLAAILLFVGMHVVREWMGMTTDTTFNTAARNPA